MSEFCLVEYANDGTVTTTHHDNVLNALVDYRLRLIKNRDLDAVIYKLVEGWTDMSADSIDDTWSLNACAYDVMHDPKWDGHDFRVLEISRDDWKDLYVVCLIGERDLDDLLTELSTDWSVYELFFDEKTDLDLFLTASDDVWDSLKTEKHIQGPKTEY